MFPHPYEITSPIILITNLCYDIHYNVHLSKLLNFSFIYKKIN